ncbi:MAG: linear amide C-N hydrolase [Pirellulales bacterium]
MPRQLAFAIRLVLAALLGIALCSPASACSAFLLKNGHLLVVGRNYDWHLEDALVMVNKRDIRKSALSFDNPLKWVSKYGSVTINQYGRELPCDGMNERGLMIGLLWLDETRYPEPDERPSLTNAQWAQYQLDTAQTVEEVIASDAHVRITNLGGALVHYFVADAHGNAAVIEFIDGKMQATTGAELPFAAITNKTYAASLKYLRKHAGFGGAREIVRSPSSLNRFVGAARASRDFAAEEKPTLPQALGTAFHTLLEIDQGERTKWSLAYDLPSRTIHFKTYSQESRRSISLQSLDFTAETPTQLAEINSVAEGDFRTALVDYTWQANRDQIRRACSLTRFAQGLPDFMIELAAKYPERNCVPIEAEKEEAELLPAGQ